MNEDEARGKYAVFGLTMGEEIAGGIFTHESISIGFIFMSNSELYPQ